MNPETHRRDVLRWGRSAYDRDEDLAAEATQLQELGFTTRLEEGLSPSLAGVNALVVHSKKRVDGAVMDQASCLSLILTTTSGYDHIDLAAAKARGIQVARSPLARRDAVIDTTLAMGFSLLRNLPFFQAEARGGTWARSALPARRMPLIRGLRVGIIGHGVIGQRAQSIWESLGAIVHFHDPAHESSTPLDVLLAQSQLLTLHCSLSPSSHEMLNAENLAKLPKGAIVLNTARGDCADLDAMCASLQAGHLGGLGLDVFPEEPCPQLSALAAMPRCLLTPHAAGYHDALGRAVTTEVLATLDAWKRNAPLPHKVT